MVAIDDATEDGSVVNSNHRIRLRSMPNEKGESKVWDVSTQAASMSQFLVDATEDCCPSDTSEDDGMILVEIDVPRVGGDCLGKVVDFLEHYQDEAMKDVPKFMNGSSFGEVMDQPWYQEFLSDENLGASRHPGTKGGEHTMLFELLEAGKFLGIPKLLDIVILRISFLLVGETAEEIRTLLKLPRMTQADEAVAREHHPWIFREEKY